MRDLSLNLLAYNLLLRKLNDIACRHPAGITPHRLFACGDLVQSGGTSALEMSASAVS